MKPCKSPECEWLLEQVKRFFKVVDVYDDVDFAMVDFVKGDYWEKRPDTPPIAAAFIKFPKRFIVVGGYVPFKNVNNPPLDLSFCRREEGDICEISPHPHIDAVYVLIELKGNYEEKLKRVLAELAKE